MQTKVFRKSVTSGIEFRCYAHFDKDDLSFTLIPTIVYLTDKEDWMIYFSWLWFNFGFLTI